MDGVDDACPVLDNNGEEISKTARMPTHVPQSGGVLGARGEGSQGAREQGRQAPGGAAYP